MLSILGVIVTDALEDLPEHHKKIFHSMLANLNKTWHDSLNSTTNPPPNVSTETEWTSEQIQTIVYVVLALLIILRTKISFRANTLHHPYRVCLMFFDFKFRTLPKQFILAMSFFVKPWNKPWFTMILLYGCLFHYAHQR